MKAIVWRKYGPPGDAGVLQCEEVEKPVPADGEVLMQVRAASVNAPDWRLLRGRPLVARLFLGLRQPKTTRTGTDVAGLVEVVGRNVTRFKPGDEVFGVCRGAFAEHACASESHLVTKPAFLTFEQVASAPGCALTALQGLRDKGHVGLGTKLLINGASGGVGSFAVQIAKSLGASVTGVCSARNLELVRSIGADHVIDYTREDFTRSGERYDVVFDCVSNHSFAARRRVLASNGTCVMVGGPKQMWLVMVRLLTPLLLSRFARQKFTFFITRAIRDDLVAIRDLMEAGTIRPLIDRSYSLTDVPEAVRYVDEGHARGKVVITVP